MKIFKSIGLIVVSFLLSLITSAVCIYLFHEFQISILIAVLLNSLLLKISKNKITVPFGITISLLIIFLISNYNGSFFNYISFYGEYGILKFLTCTLLIWLLYFLCIGKYKKFVVTVMILLMFYFLTYVSLCVYFINLDSNTPEKAIKEYVYQSNGPILPLLIRIENNNYLDASGYSFTVRGFKNQFGQEVFHFYLLKNQYVKWYVSEVGT